MSRTSGNGLNDFYLLLAKERAARQAEISSLRDELMVSIKGLASQNECQRGFAVIEKVSKSVEEETLARKRDMASLSKKTQELLRVGWGKLKEELATLPDGTVLKTAESFSGSDKPAPDLAGYIDYSALLESHDKLFEEVAMLKTKIDAATRAKSRERSISQQRDTRTDDVEIMSKNIKTITDVLARLQEQVESVQAALPDMWAKPGDSASIPKGVPKIIAQKPSSMGMKFGTSTCFGPPIHIAKRDSTFPQNQVPTVTETSWHSPKPFPRSPRVALSGEQSVASRLRSSSQESRSQMMVQLQASVRNRSPSQESQPQELRLRGSARLAVNPGGYSPRMASSRMPNVHSDSVDVVPAICRVISAPPEWSQARSRSPEAKPLQGNVAANSSNIVLESVLMSPRMQTSTPSLVIGDTHRIPSMRQAQSLSAVPTMTSGQTQSLSAVPTLAPGAGNLKSIHQSSLSAVPPLSPNAGNLKSMMCQGSLLQGSLSAVPSL